MAANQNSYSLELINKIKALDPGFSIPEKYKDPSTGEIVTYPIRDENGILHNWSAQGTEKTSNSDVFIDGDFERELVRYLRTTFLKLGGKTEENKLTFDTVIKSDEYDRFAKAYFFVHYHHEKLSFNGFPVDETSPIFSVDNILPSETLTAILQQVYDENNSSAQLKRFPRENDLLGRRDIEFYRNGEAGTFATELKVTFDNAHNIIARDFQQNGFKTKEIEQLAYDTLSYFGKKYKLVDTNSFFCNLLEYSFNSSTPDGPWHFDFFAKNSMVIMLTNPNDPQTGWHGGNLQFLPRDGDGVFTESEIPPYQLQHAQNRAIFFCNFAASHRVTAMKPSTGSSSKRLIFTLFQKEKGTHFCDSDLTNKEDRILQGVVQLFK